MNKHIEIEITPELLAAAKRRRFLLENASDLANLPSEIWNKDYKASIQTLSHALAHAIEKSEVPADGNNPPN